MRYSKRMEKIYHVDLTPKQRKHLRKIVRVGTNKAKVISRAHILLKSNEGKTDKEIADLLYIDEETVRRTRQRFWNRDRGAYAPLPHHRTCGSASGGSVKCDEVGIVPENSPVRTVANRHCSARDEPVAIWTAAMVPNSSLQRERPSILKPLLLLDSRIGSVVSSIVSTRFVASAGAAICQSQPYALGHQPGHNSSPSR